MATRPSPSSSNTWGEWMPSYGMYPQYHYMVVPETTVQSAPPLPSESLKRPHPEAGNKDHHILWMQNYDKPIPESVKNKCKPLYCEVCSVNLNSVIQAKMHYEGKLHEKKVRFLLTNWAKDNNTVPPRKNNETIQQPEAKRFVYEHKDLYCGPCDTSFTSNAHAQQHFSGRNHKRVMSGLSPLKAGYFNSRTGKWQRQPLPVQEEASPTPPAENSYPLPPPPPPPPPPAPPSTLPPEGPKYFCNICGVNATSQVQLEMHLSGRNHKSRCAKSKPEVPSSPEKKTVAVLPNTKKDYSIYRTPSGQFYCALCNLCVNSEHQFVQHMASRKHKLKESSAKGKKTKNKK